MSTQPPPLPLQPAGPAIAPSTAPAQVCPPFRAEVLRRQLTTDSTLRWGALVVVVVGFFLLHGDADSADQWLMALPIVIAWIGVSFPSARVLPLLPRIDAMIGQNPPVAEMLIAMSLRRRPLQPHLRLLLYYRLAVLRQSQQRFAESAAICHAILDHRLGRAERIRPQLLMLLVEAHLVAGDLPGAYEGLASLAQSKLSLLGSLQHLALKTRYEVMAGYDAQALDDIYRKIDMAELMPAPQCGALHAMLAVAAQRSRHPTLAAWLGARAELLCGSVNLIDLFQARSVVTAMAADISTTPGSPASQSP